jgi:hypothetical protein
MPQKHNNTKLITIYAVFTAHYLRDGLISTQTLDL